MAGRKIFVGSLPNGIQEPAIRAKFEEYGQIEDVYIKQGCEPGRQWAFVTFAAPEQAQLAKERTDRQLQFPGTEHPCDVMVARNQGMFGQQSLPGDHPPPAQAAIGLGGEAEGPKKIFVGSLPDGITAQEVKTEFSKYGMIQDTYLKEGCEPGRQWAFVTFTNSKDAQLAKQSTDRILVMPGGTRPCEVTLARNQGMYGQETLASSAPAPGYGAPMPAVAASSGPRKVFVGSLPDDVSETMLRGEYERYGQIVDVFVKNGCESGRQWAFVTFATAEQANAAKEGTDRILMLPGATRACEVMLAKNQGKFGQDAMGAAGNSAAAGSYPPGAMVYPGAAGYQVPMAGAYGMAVAPAYGYVPAGAGAGPPPPPSAPPPAHLTPWRCYHTAAGLPYYHNHATGQTQWECPPEFQVAAMPGQQVRYSPY